MLKIISILLIFSFANFFQVSFCGKNVESPKTKSTIIEKNSDKTTAGKSITISELNEQNPSEGKFELKGFVVKIYTCPACPPDSQCKPCMKSNIVISEENKSLKSYDLTEKELIIFTNKAKEFIENREYKFNVKITDKKTTSEELNDVELIKAELVKD